jgi:carboxymethylenebutenolidase
MTYCAGVIGFCMGGGFALLLSAEGYDAASVNYGMVPSDIDELAARAGPIVASYGGRDWTARRDAQLVMSLRRKYQKANQIAMMA